MNERVAAKEVGNQLDRITDFRYFLLFGTFVLYLDFYLTQFTGQSLTQFEYGGSLAGLRAGHVLVFVATFGFMVTFVVSASQYVFQGIAVAIPWSCPERRNRAFTPEESLYYSYPTQILEYSVHDYNPIAYEIYKSEILEASNRKLLYSASLAFLYASLLNTYSYLFGPDLANPLSGILHAATISDTPILFNLVFLFLGGLYMFTIYVGFFASACDFGGSRRVYFPAGAIWRKQRGARRRALNGDA